MRALEGEESASEKKELYWCMCNAACTVGVAPCAVLLAAMLLTWGKAFLTVAGKRLCRVEPAMHG